MKLCYNENQDYLNYFFGDGKMNEEKIYDLADLFKMFGDSTRLRIMSALFDREKSVTELSEELNMTPSAISHQLAQLKKAKLLRSRREGKQNFYALDDEHVKMIIAMGREHVSHIHTGNITKISPKLKHES